jgi:hypothetical protein
MSTTVRPEPRPRTAADRAAGAPRPPEPAPPVHLPANGDRAELTVRATAPNGDTPEKQLLTAGRLAELLVVSERYVHRHARALGGVHLPGRGDRPGPLRFNWTTVAAKLAELQKAQREAESAGEASQRSQAPEQPAAPAVRRSSPPVAPGTRVRLLPDRGF